MSGQESQARAQGDTPGAAEGGRCLRGPLLRELRPPYQRRSGQIAAVLMYHNGGHSVLWPDAREDHRRPWMRSPYTVFEIALGRNVTRFDLALPARGDAEFFQAAASVQWKVEDPVEVVRSQVWDVAELLRDELLDQLREVSRRFRLTEAQRADEAVRTELNSGSFALGSELGLSARVHVFIDLSERVMERIREGTGLEHRLDLAEKEHALTFRQEQHASLLVRERARSFESVLLGGDETKIAHFMARDPGRALEIQQLFARERRQGEADWLEFIGKLIEGGQLERHDIGEHMYEVLQHLRERSSRVVGGTADMALSEKPERRGEVGRAQLGRAESDGGAGPGRRRPFWEEDDGDAALPGPDASEGAAARGSAARADGELDLPSVHEPLVRDPLVREPTRVESSGERDERRERGQGAGPSDAPGTSRSRTGRASDRFDDWGDS
ncbi:hypothetical protein [Streptomyces sp. ODS28]|uniref:hypothetical protein n=1 Tax=Streptomyces sp. ODS28 TaxID=3136688 RepID=UPI0031F0A79E